MPEMPGIYGQIATAFGVALTAAGIAWRKWRHYQRLDAGDDVRTRAENTLIIRLQEQAKNNLDRAERAEAERNVLILQIGDLKAQVQILTERIAAMQDQMTEQHGELLELRALVRARRSEDRATNLQRDIDDANKSG